MFIHLIHSVYKMPDVANAMKQKCLKPVLRLDGSNLCKKWQWRSKWRRRADVSWPRAGSLACGSVPGKDNCAGSHFWLPKRVSHHRLVCHRQTCWNFTPKIHVVQVSIVSLHGINKGGTADVLCRPFLDSQLLLLKYFVGCWHNRQWHVLSSSAASHSLKSFFAIPSMQQLAGHRWIPQFVRLPVKVVIRFHYRDNPAVL